MHLSAITSFIAVALLIAWLARKRHSRTLIIAVVSLVLLPVFGRPILGFLPINSVDTGATKLHVHKDLWSALQRELDDPQTISMIASRVENLRFTPEQLSRLHQYHQQPDANDPQLNFISVRVAIRNVTRRDVQAVLDYAEQLGTWARERTTNQLEHRL